jgi:hypothetical protein
MMKIESLKEKTYKNAKLLISDVIFEEICFPSRDFIFRGESTITYKLLPSALRDHHLEKILGRRNLNYSKGFLDYPDANLMFIEYKKLQNFYEVCNRRGIHLPLINIFEKEADYLMPAVKRDNQLEKWIPEDLLEIAALAQHYGLPTRLLDWSHDFFTALYFASKGAVQTYYKKKSEHDKKEDFKNFEKEFIKDYIVIWALHKGNSLFKKDHENHLPILLVRPLYHRNPNLAAQTGIFTHYQTEWQSINDSKINRIKVDVTPLDERIKAIKKVDAPVLYKFTLPITQAKMALKNLQNMGIDASKFFPGVEGAVKATEEKYLANSTDWPWA